MLEMWLKMTMLGLEAQQVMWLRTMRIAAGGRLGEREVRRMIGEKVTAAAQAAGTIATGGSADAVVRGYRRKVRANSKRLSR